MQAVILAAGKGTRCYPLTLTRPKALLKIANKTVIEHNLEQLVGLVDEVIIVIGHKGDEIKECIGNRFKGIKVRYVEQHAQNGTGKALELCKDQINGRFIVLNGDDLYSAQDIRSCIQHRYAVMAQQVPDPEHWGIFEINGRFVKSLNEKPANSTSGLANTGLYVLDKTIFNHKLRKTKRGEYEATDYISYLIEKEKVVCERVKDFWLPVGYPWSILEANESLLKRMKKSVIKGTIEKGVTIKGTVFLGEGSVIKSGSYLEGNVVIGRNCVIGPNCYIRGDSAIGNGCKVGNSVEIKNSVLFDNTKVPHLSYVGDSVLGENVNFGAGTITANLRFDHGYVKMVVNGKKIDSGRKKLGCVVGDGAQTGIHVSIMPGVKLWPQVIIKPGETVYEDVKQI